MTQCRGRVFAQLFAAWGLLFALPHAANAVGLIRVSEPSLCVDGMEMDPHADDEDVIPVAADGGCMIPQRDIIRI